MAMASVPRRVRVVLADDTAEIRMLVRLGLELDGRFDVVAEVADGEAAVRACGEQQPDIAILDLAMPIMDGLQAIPLVRRASPRTRIAVLSAFSSNQMAAEARASGADAYVEKGTATDRLVGVLADLAGIVPNAQPLRRLPAEEQRPSVARLAPAAPAEAQPTTSIAPLDDMIDLIRHELRTPLVLADGFAQLLGKAIDAGDAATAYERLEDIQRNIGLAQRLLTLLADSDGPDSRDPGEPEPVDLARVVHRLSGDFGAMAAEHRVVVSAPQRVVVLANEDRISEVLSNLVTNAAKFSPAGTAIEITVASVRGYAEVAVRDEGPGVPVEEEGRLFTRFGRLSRDRTTAGMGLGLYLSRRIATSLGGDLVLQRPEGGGSRFVLRLPVCLA